MKGKTLSELSTKGVQMRCEDYYGRHPERDGPILVGIFIGRQRFTHFCNYYYHNNQFIG